MAERSGFFNAVNQDGTYDREYDATDFTDYFSLFIGDGVFVNPANQLQVVAKSGLTVTVKAGAAFIEGCWYILTEDMDVIIPANTAQYAVNTNVCVTLSRTDRQIVCKVRPAVSSVLPVNDGVEHDLVLATISVGVGASSISNANITDRRPSKQYCGYVTGLVDQIDTSDLFQQFTTAFQEWFDSIKDKLGDDAATNLQKQLDTLKSKHDTDIEGVQTLITQTNAMLSQSIGSLENRLTTNVNAINNIIGSLSSLTTSAKRSIVSAINWLKSQIDSVKSSYATLNNRVNTLYGFQIVDIVKMDLSYSSADYPQTVHYCTGDAVSTKNLSGCSFYTAFVKGNYVVPVEDAIVTLTGSSNLHVGQSFRNVSEETHTFLGTVLVICYKR